MKKTIFALLLLVALVAVMAIPAMAAEGTLENHCVCGDMKCNGTPDKADDEHHMETWQAWDGTGDLKTTGYWYLTANVEITEKITPAIGAEGAVNVLGIDLNGFTISGKGNDAPERIFYLNMPYSKLVLTDNKGTGKVDYTNTIKTYGMGINLPVANVTCDMYGGTITGTRAAATGGAGVQIGDNANSTSIFNMYGGVITGGQASAPTTRADRGGGNVELTKGVFNMYGGTVSNGTAVEGSNGIVGNFFLVGGQVNVRGGKIIGGSSVHGPAIYAMAGHVRLEGGVVTSGTKDTTLVTGVYFDPATGGNMIANGAKAIKLEGDTKSFRSESPIELDLNGYTVTKAVIRGTKANLKLYDSQTADYTVADNKYGKVNQIVFEQEATAAANMTTDFVNSSNQRYLTIKDGETYSAHRIFLSVSHYVLPDDANGLNYKTTFKCDEVIAGLVGKNYGIVVTNGDQTSDPISYNADVVANNDNAKTAQVNGFLVKATETGADKNAENAAKEIKVKAFVKIGDQTVNSSEKTTTFAAVVAKTETMELDDAQKTILKNLYNDYNVGGFMDSWWIKSLAA